jgi:hypothetical protein
MVSELAALMSQENIKNQDQVKLSSYTQHNDIQHNKK